MNDKKVLALGFLSAIVLLLVLSIMFFPNNTNTIKIGVSYPLTGAAASHGIGGLAGVEYAVNEINSAGGINGQMIELVIEDDQCDPTESVRVANKLVNIDNVDLVIGFICSGAAEAAIPIIQESKTSILLTGASKPELTQNNDYVFRVYLNDNTIGKETARYLYSEKNYKNVAVIFENNAWGAGLRKVFVETFENLGGSIVFDEGIATSSSDIKTTLTKLKTVNAEALFFPVYEENFLAGAKQMKELGIELPVYSGDIVHSENVITSEISEGKKIVMGKVNFPKEKEDSIKSFSNRTTNIVTPLGYDALMVAVQAIEKAGTDKTALRNALTQTNYQGISTPSIQFDSEGELLEISIEIKEIQNKQAITIYEN